MNGIGAVVDRLLEAGVRLGRHGDLPILLATRVVRAAYGVELRLETVVAAVRAL